MLKVRIKQVLEKCLENSTRRRKKTPIAVSVDTRLFPERKHAIQQLQEQYS